jgi:hypothetical protein
VFLQVLLREVAAPSGDHRVATSAICALCRNVREELIKRVCVVQRRPMAALATHAIGDVGRLLLVRVALETLAYSREMHRVSPKLLCEVGAVKAGLAERLRHKTAPRHKERDSQETED